MEDKTFMEVINERRSIRSYCSKPVSDADIKDLIWAAARAPSAHNSQPWEFAVVKSNPNKEKLARKMADNLKMEMLNNNLPDAVIGQKVNKSITNFCNAPVIIISLLNTKKIKRNPVNKSLKEEYIMATQSLAAATGQLLLAAVAKGLGACWYAAPLFCGEVIREELNLRGKVEPQALITLGYSRENPAPKNRMNIEEITKWY